MLNFRKIRQEFSNSLLQKGQETINQGLINKVKFNKICDDITKVECLFRIEENSEKTINTKIEFDNLDSSIIDSYCSCGAVVDCKHIVGLALYIEKNFQNIISEQVNNSKNSLDQKHTKDVIKGVKNLVKTTSHTSNFNIIQEYIKAFDLINTSPLLSKRNNNILKTGKLYMHFLTGGPHDKIVIVKLFVKLYGKKPAIIPDIDLYQQAIRRSMYLDINGVKVNPLSIEFDEASKVLFNYTKNSIRKIPSRYGLGEIDLSTFGDILSSMLNFSSDYVMPETGQTVKILNNILNIPQDSVSDPKPIIINPENALVHCNVKTLYIPETQIILDPVIQISDKLLPIDRCIILEGEVPMLISDNEINLFNQDISSEHIESLRKIKDTAIPESLMGTLIQKSIPCLQEKINLVGLDKLHDVKTVKSSNELQAVCILDYVKPQLDIKINFIYNGVEIPSNLHSLTTNHLLAFKTPNGILERDIDSENELISQLFSNFNLSEREGVFSCKNDKHIIDFMSKKIPSLPKVSFKLPSTLENKFIYDNSQLTIISELSPNKKEVISSISFDGKITGLMVSDLISVLNSSESYINLNNFKDTSFDLEKKKLLVIKKDNIKHIVELLSYLGIKKIENTSINTPIWTISRLIYEKQHPKSFVKISINKDIENLYLSISKSKETPIQRPLPSLLKKKIIFNNELIDLKIRPYQLSGINWLTTMGKHGLNALLADDMGLGKTLQIITTLAYYIDENPNSLSLIICPSSLIYNWFNEFEKFSNIKAQKINGNPLLRKDIIENARKNKINVLIASYSSSQKDINIINKQGEFDYLIVDEAQYIKNNSTITHKIVNSIKAKNKINVTGTPIENIISDLFNILHFLIPGILGNQCAFRSKCSNLNSSDDKDEFIDYVKSIINPFILRRIRTDVLKDLPPVSEIDIKCDLTKVQSKMYSALTKKAKKEISVIINQKGITKAKLHIFSYLTKLKQICCHPGIINKELLTDLTTSGKYVLFKSLLETTMNSKRRVIIFSQYTRMLGIIKEDLQSEGIPFCYIDGSTKDREQEIFKFENQREIPVFLISLKSGGVGLNITSADTIIHYDLSWNPSIEAQATSRVYRIGQTNPVLVYRIISNNTIEDRIIQVQQNKQFLIDGIINANALRGNLTMEDIDLLLSDES